jgi:hypothetical protein
VLTLRQIHEDVERELEVLESLVAVVTQTGDDQARDESNYKVLYAQSRLRIRAEALEKLTVDEVADRALIECDEAHLAYLISQNRLTTTREALRASQARLDALRTLSASFRTAGG